MKYFINFLSLVLIITLIKELNSIKCYECNNCTKITDNIPVLSQCRRCLVNKTQTGIIRSCIQSCPLITLRECRQNSVKCCKKDLCNFANLLLASGNNPGSNNLSDSVETCDEKGKSSKKKGLRSLFRHVSHSKHSNRSQCSTSEPKTLEAIPAINPSDVKEKPLHNNRKPLWDVLETGGSTRSSSLSGYETQLPIDYHIGAAFLDSNNPKSKKSVESISDRGVFPAEVSNSSSSACNTSLSSKTIMTVTNSTPETQNNRSFHTSVPRAYASMPHAMLPIYYGCEPSNNLQSSPRTESVTSTNVYSLNKLMGDYKPINSHSVLSSSSSPVSDFVGADAAPGSGNATCHDDLTNSIDSELTACKIQQLQHDMVQLETAIKDNLNEQKELNDRLFEQLAEVSKPEINKNKSPSSLLSLSSLSNDQSVSHESEIKRIYSEKLKTLKKQFKALNEQLQTTRYVISKSTTYDDSAYRKKSSARPVGYSFFTPNDRKKHKKMTKSHLATSNLLYPPDTSSLLLPENVASGSSQPLRTGSLPSTNGVNPISCGGYDAGGRSMISGLSGMIGTSKDDTCPSIDPSVAVNSNTGAFSWSDSGDNTLARIFEFLGVSPNQVFNSQNLISIGNNNVPGVGSSGSSALSASGLGVLDKAKAGSKSHISGANVISPESLSTPHTGGIVTGGLSGGVAAGSIGHLGNSTMNISPHNLALAFAYLYRRQECQFASLTNQQSQIFQELRDELSVMHSETLSIQSTLNNLTTELEAIRRDATTKAELQNQKLTDASSRIERLDAIAEESRQALPHELAAIRNEFHDSLYSVEYQVTTKIRDLSDNITSINNKVSMIEKPHDQSNTLESHGTELDRIRRKVLHYLTDLCVSFFALVTMLLQVLIRCLNLGAVLTENRKLAVCFSMTLLASCLLVYTSDPIILWLREDDTITNPATTTTTIHRRSQYWRNILIAILSFFRSFSREMT